MATAKQRLGKILKIHVTPLIGEIPLVQRSWEDKLWTQEVPSSIK